MPDVWTFAPDDLRSALGGLGAPCGVDPRVIEDRPSEWTCYADGPSAGYDIYIHDARAFPSSFQIYSTFVLLFIGGLFAGLLWGKRFWRRAPRILPERVTRTPSQT